MASKRGIHEVWARVAVAALDLGKLAGFAPSDVLRDVPFDEAALARLKHVSWHDYISIVERLGELAGSPESFEELTATQYHATLPEGAQLARAFVTPKLLIRFILEVVDPVLWPPIKFEYDDLGGDVVRMGMYLRPGARPSRAFFEVNSGAFRCIPRHLGLPETEILSADISETHGIWEGRLPPPRTIVHRVRRLVTRLVLGAEPDGSPIATTFGNTEPDSLEARLDDASRVWGLTPKQSEVLGLVAQGESNKDIARQLACADNTVELHVTQLLRRSGRTSRGQLIAAFWSTDWGSPG